MTPGAVRRRRFLRKSTRLNKLADARESLRQLTGQEYMRNSIAQRTDAAVAAQTERSRGMGAHGAGNNLKLRSAGFGVDQARENIQLQKAGHYPTLDLRASRADLDNGVIATTSAVRSICN
jgi:outer membrane protein